MIANMSTAPTLRHVYVEFIHMNGKHNGQEQRAPFKSITS